MRLRLPAESRADPDAIGALTLRTPRGELVELRSLARLESGEGPSQIERQALKRQVTMLANLKGYSLGEAIGFLNGVAKDFPPTVQTDFEGQGKELANTAREFLMALFLGVVLIYMILAAQFESLLDPVTIMLSLPLAVIGAIAALLLANEFMSMLAMIGMIMLAGLVTKNGILIVEFTNQLRARGALDAGGAARGGPAAAPPDPHDLDRDDRRHDPGRLRARRRRRDAHRHGLGDHRRPHRLDGAHARGGAGGVLDARRAAPPDSCAPRPTCTAPRTARSGPRSAEARAARRTREGLPRLAGEPFVHSRARV